MYPLLSEGFCWLCTLVVKENLQLTEKTLHCWLTGFQLITGASFKQNFKLARLFLIDELDSINSEWLRRGWVFGLVKLQNFCICAFEDSLCFCTIFCSNRIITLLFTLSLHVSTPCVSCMHHSYQIIFYASCNSFSIPF